MKCQSHGNVKLHSSNFPTKPLIHVRNYQISIETVLAGMALNMLGRADDISRLVLRQAYWQDDPCSQRGLHRVANKLTAKTGLFGLSSWPA